jgi:hypothetical protein
VLAGGLIFLLFVRPLLPHSVPGTVDLRVTDLTKTSNGVLRVSAILTNSTPLTLNVIDDADGNPAFILDDGSPPGTSLNRMANDAKINLAPGATLTNTVFLTNPPSRFRLKLQLRDLADERRRRWPMPVWRLLPEPWRSEFVQWDLKRHKRWVPASGWILPELPKDMQPAQPQ